MLNCQVPSVKRVRVCDVFVGCGCRVFVLLVSSSFRDSSKQSRVASHPLPSLLLFGLLQSWQPDSLKGVLALCARVVECRKRHTHSSDDWYSNSGGGCHMQCLIKRSPPVTSMNDHDCLEIDSRQGQSVTWCHPSVHLLISIAILTPKDLPNFLSHHPIYSHHYVCGSIYLA